MARYMYVGQYCSINFNIIFSSQIKFEVNIHT